MPVVNADDVVSIAKAIPSLLEPSTAGVSVIACVGFNRESDSVTVGAISLWPDSRASLRFQSRKRFRHCWSHFILSFSLAANCCFNRESDSVTVGAQHCYDMYAESIGFNRESDSVTVGAQVEAWLAKCGYQVSIAKAIPSLLEPYFSCRKIASCSSFNRESDSVTVGARYNANPH